MRKIRFEVGVDCIGAYNSTIDVPDNATDNEIRELIYKDVVKEITIDFWTEGGMGTK
jgi:hypothetical protein